MYTYDIIYDIVIVIVILHVYNQFDMCAFAQDGEQTWLHLHETFGALRLRECDVRPGAVLQAGPCRPIGRGLGQRSSFLVRYSDSKICLH